MTQMTYAAAMLALHGQAYAAPTIQGATTVAPGKLVRLEVSSAPPRAVHRWIITPSTDVDRADTADHRCQFVAPPGRYDVTCIQVAPIEGGTYSLDVVTATVTFGETVPPKPEPDPKPDPGASIEDVAKGISRVKFGDAGCTAVAVWPPRADGRWDILSAAHCVGEPGTRGIMMLQDGRRIAVTVSAVDRDSDIAWFVTDTRVDAMFYGRLATEKPSTQTPVWHAGYGLTDPGKRKNGRFTGVETSDGKWEYKLLVNSGDSGGPIVHAHTGRILGAVCCTTGRGVVAEVYAGTALAAAALRPHPTTGATTAAWQPVEIPLAKRR